MTESAGSRLDNPGKQRARWWQWLLLPALALVLCWWYFGRIGSYHLVMSFPTQAVTLIPAQTGFLTHDSADSFVLRDWSGKQRWSVKTPLPMFSQGQAGNRMGFGSTYALSPDGHVFAAVTVMSQAMQAQVWRDGQAESHLQIPVHGMPPRILFARVLNSGRLFTWYTSGNQRRPLQILSPQATPVWVIEKDQVIATGSLLSHSLIAADGGMLLWQAQNNLTAADLRVSGSQIVLHNRFTIRDSDGLDISVSGFQHDIAMFDGGTLLSSRGAVYHHGILQHAMDGWEHEEIAPGGQFTLQHRENHVRILSPADEKSWEFTVRNTVMGGDATQDGRHAFVWCGSESSESLGELFRRSPYLERFIGEPSFGYLMLYQYPGRRVAIFRQRLNYWWPGAAAAEQEVWYPSPDGRTIAMTIATRSGCRCFLFKY